MIGPRPLTAAEIAAVKSFAAAHGKNWKFRLVDSYWRRSRPWPGGEPGDGSLLQRLRIDKDFGAIGLRRFKLPKD